MIWSFDNTKNVWNLTDGDSIIARIFIQEKSGQANPYIAKSLTASVYSSAHTFNKLARSNKNWKSNTRKFKTKEELDYYINTKKNSIVNYLRRF